MSATPRLLRTGHSPVFLGMFTALIALIALPAAAGAGAPRSKRVAAHLPAEALKAMKAAARGDYLRAAAHYDKLAQARKSEAVWQLKRADALDRAGVRGAALQQLERLVNRFRTRKEQHKVVLRARRLRRVIANRVPIKPSNTAWLAPATMPGRSFPPATFKRTTGGWARIPAFIPAPSAEERRAIAEKARRERLAKEAAEKAERERKRKAELARAERERKAAVAAAKAKEARAARLERERKAAAKAERARQAKRKREREVAAATAAKAATAAAAAKAKAKAEAVRAAALEQRRKAALAAAKAEAERRRIATAKVERERVAQQERARKTEQAAAAAKREKTAAARADASVAGRPGKATAPPAPKAKLASVSPPVQRTSQPLAASSRPSGAAPNRSAKRSGRTERPSVVRIAPAASPAAAVASAQTRPRRPTKRSGGSSGLRIAKWIVGGLLGAAGGFLMWDAVETAGSINQPTAWLGFYGDQDARAAYREYQYTHQSADDQHSTGIAMVVGGAVVMGWAALSD